MGKAYAGIIASNLERLFADGSRDPAAVLPATAGDGGLEFMAFGRQCRLSPEGVFFDGCQDMGPRAIVVTLYGLTARDEPCRLEPFRAYTEFANTMPYAGAFVTHSEQPLVPLVESLAENYSKVLEIFNGRDGRDITGGDLSLILYPLPKVALCYVCYLADEDFPASVKCLFSSNADRFLPPDAMADLAEYTTAAVIETVAA